MGNFIEDLRKQKAAEEQVIAEKKAEEERVSGLERAKKERKDEQEAIKDKIREENWQKAKDYFEQTGLRKMLNELISIKGAEKLKEWDYMMSSGSSDYVARLEIGHRRRSNYAEFIEIFVLPDGTVVFEGEELKNERKGFLRLSQGYKAFPLKFEISKNEWSGENGKGRLEEALGRAYHNPISKYDPPSSSYGYHLNNTPPGDGPCLLDSSLISVFGGSIRVKNLKSGGLVWTINKHGNKVQTSILLKTKRRVSQGHKMAHIVLEDGRKLTVSPGHPTIDNKELGSLKKGQILDGSKIASIKILPYKGKYTHDILPSGDTGAYWANGILIGSTLSDQFRRIQVENKHDRQISWYSRLFA